MTIFQERKIARAAARLLGTAHGCAAMTIFQESKIARPQDAREGAVHGGTA
jgi:hypothetical protein